MKLIFTKDSNNEINVQLQKGTVIEDFSYTEMVGQLLTQNVFDDTDFTNLSEEEKTKIQIMLGKISLVFQEDEVEPDSPAISPQQ
ncbi:hypothetical protein OD917_06695 [Flavobacterium sp. SH_e]|uniref:hypothetical protein n=1 Tax=Flavobacterium sp. SH_e TaxID=2983767 RepID=UPI0021E497C0|nr:hypothetical protein [Flavobacterium sp. SH_e]MCV2484606.1 hypothetical protein [Flavobacterium sp. SH_e]